MSLASLADQNLRPSLAKMSHMHGLCVEIDSQFSRVEERWSKLAHASGALPFQHVNWLKNWYQTLGHQEHVKPLLLTLSDATTGSDILALPLCWHVRQGLRVISFADLGFTDYNAPLLGSDAVRSSCSAETLLAAILANLPDADVLELEKMPRLISSHVNPFSTLTTQHSKFSGNILHVPNTWDEWHWGLERTFRKELERSWRVFCKYPHSEFKQITNRSEAIDVFEQLKALQASRIVNSGLDYQLNAPVIDQFYDDVLINGLESGTTILTALRVETEVVAALMGISDGAHYAMVRLGTGGEKWKSCSPGRLVIERTMRHLHEQGFRKFDFTIGDYAYKRRLGVTQIELYDYRQALSVKGQAYMSWLTLKGALKSSPLARQGIGSLKRIFKKSNPPHAPSGAKI